MPNPPLDLLRYRDKVAAESELYYSRFSQDFIVLMSQVLRGPDGSFTQAATLRLVPTLANRGVLIELLEDALELLRYGLEAPPHAQVPEDEIDPFAFAASVPDELPDLPNREILRRKDLEPDNVTMTEHLLNKVKRAAVPKKAASPTKAKRKPSAKSEKKHGKPSSTSRSAPRQTESTDPKPKGRNRRRNK